MQDFLLKLNSSVEKLINEPQMLARAKFFIEKEDFWSLANLLGENYNFNQVSQECRDNSIKIISDIREYMGNKARTSKETTTVVFGTSGWRGRIGEDFTILNVHKVSRAIIDMMRSEEFLKTNGYSSFKEVQSKGILMFRDNRYLGDEFMDAAMKELANAGINILFAGECPTGIGSAVLTELGAAGSFNFTPSHNPMDYAGLKFNPGDGGPADANLTNIIMKETIKYMENDSFISANVDYKYLQVNPVESFISLINKNELLDLTAIKRYLASVKNDLCLVIDNMHGSSRGYIQAIFGKELMTELEQAKAIRFVNTEDDFSFHGVKPEPSTKNMHDIIEMAKESGRKLTLVASLDPDGDRIRLGTANSDIEMNKFGAIVYGGFLDSGIKGPIASSLPTSDFALNIAKAEGQKVYETKVGFKWFRPYRDALVCFEESDGISIKGHTLEKDAIIGLLLAIEVMRTKSKDIFEYYQELQQRYGFYYPDKQGVDVHGVSVEEWQQYKSNVVDVLQKKMFKIGDSVLLNGENKIINNIIIDDGLKIIFNDNSWIMLRPSGTEPKFRIYFEVTSKEKLEEPSSVLGGYFKAGQGILDRAREKVKS